MKKKLLLVGGNYADIPIIKAAKELGYWVVTSGNNPDDLGHVYADETYLEDYSSPEKILELAKILKVDAICASCNDFSALSCSFTAQHLNLPGHDKFEVSLVIHHKDKFRAFAMQNNILVPKAISMIKNSIKTKDLGLSYPIMVKPVDLSGGKGITKVHRQEELDDAITKAFSLSNSEQIVLEEFIEGSNHGYSTFIKDGKVVFAFMDDEHYFKNPYLVSGASTSLKFSRNIEKKLNIVLEDMASKLDLVDGLLHVQFILKDEMPYIIEICRRTPGDLYVKLVEYATGYEMSKAIVKAAAFNTVDAYRTKEIKYVTRHCIMSSKNGYIEAVDYGDFKSRIVDKMVFYKKGDLIKNYLVYKAEIDFIRYDNRADAMENIKSVENNIKLELLS